MQMSDQDLIETFELLRAEFGPKSWNGSALDTHPWFRTCSPVPSAQSNHSDNSPGAGSLSDHVSRLASVFFFGGTCRINKGSDRWRSRGAAAGARWRAGPRSILLQAFIYAIAFLCGLQAVGKKDSCRAGLNEALMPDGVWRFSAGYCLRICTWLSCEWLWVLCSSTLWLLF